jgi:Tol biopolymer transport system component
MRPFTKLPVHVGPVVWSYDSRCVAFELDDLILVMPCQPGPTARPAPLTSPEASGTLQDPAFSPSGRYLACILSLSKETAAGSGDREVSSDLWVMRSDGKQPRRLTSSGTCFDPEW